MNALISYLRHAIVTWLLVLLEKYQFPVEGLEDAVNLIVLTVLGTLSWAFVKYVAPYLKEPKAIAIFVAGLSTIAMLPSCTIQMGTNGKPQVGIDPYSAKQVINSWAGKLNQKIQATK